MKVQMTNLPLARSAASHSSKRDVKKMMARAMMKTTAKSTAFA